MAGRELDEHFLDDESIREAPTILVVDDEAPVRHFLRVILERLGYRVETASGGAEAIRMAGERSFDVVLTDLIMPRVDGLKVIQGVKELSPETQVVVITGYPSSETIVAATRAGALDYLPKSPDPEHLAVLVEKAMEIRQLQRKAKERDYYLRMAQMDGLTELFNQFAFHRFLNQEFNRSKRDDRPISLVFADIDGFAEFNKLSGRLYGDQLLQQVGLVLKRTCRNYDIVARYGADEFAILAPATDKEGGEHLGHRVRDAVQGLRPRVGQMASEVSLCVGVAAFPADAAESSTLLEKAEEALQSARSQGPGIVITI